VKIFGTVRDQFGKPIPNKGVQIFDGYRLYGVRSDKNGNYERKFYPYQDSYQTSTYYNGNNGYSKTVDVSH
jgi:hypothetical protein